MWRMEEVDATIEKLLAPRIVKNCWPQFENGHFKDSAREAMVQVEMALREKGKVEGIQFGAALIGNLFAGKHGVKLRIPLGDELQSQARKYFEGVFSYYRNYAAHDGSRIDDRIALRILIVASELLELIDASELTLTDHGGVDGLVRIGGFGTAERLGALLNLLDDYWMPESTYDGLYDDLAETGFWEPELEAVFRLNLVEMHSAEYETPEGGFWDSVEIIEWIKLTDLGRKTLDSLNTSTR